MKQQFSNIIHAVGALMLLSVVFTACKKETTYDITGDKANKVYITTANTTVNNYNLYSFSVINTPAGIIGVVKVALPVKSTMPVANAVAVSVSVDNTLVDSYNAAKGTTYSKIPDGVVSFGSPTITIPQGQSISADSIKLSIPAEKLALLTDKGYLVAVKITSATGDANTQVSDSQRIFYVVVKTSKSSIFPSPVESDMTGMLITDRSQWTATTNPDPAFGSPSAMFDGDNNSYMYFLSPQLQLDVNLGSVSNITGIRLQTFFSGYGLTSANVSVSADGVTYTDYGVANFTSSDGYQYIKFYAPVAAKFIRINPISTESSFLVFAEFDAYKQ